MQGTRIVQATPNSLNVNYKSAVMAVVRRLNVTLVSISTLEMWGASGFLAKAFSHFDALGIAPVPYFYPLGNISFPTRLI